MNMLDLATDRKDSEELIEVYLRGRMDALSSADFDRFFDELLQAGNRYYLLDVSQLQSVSSAGISALIRLRRSLQKVAGRLALVRPSAELQGLLNFFSLQQSFPVFADRASALRSLQADLPAQSAALQLQTNKRNLDPRGARLSKSDEQRAENQPSAASAKLARRMPAQSSREIPETSASPLEHKDLPEQAQPASGPAEASLHRHWHRMRPPLAEQATTAQRAGDEQMARYMAGHASSGDLITEEPEESPLEEGALVRQFKQPHIIRCQECGIGLRLYQSGPHICAGCGIEFDVKPDGQTYYFQTT